MACAQMMPLNRLLRDGDHEDLAEERRTATFDTDEMAAIIWGNREVVSRRRQITKRVAEHPELQDPYSQAFMTRTEHMDHAARKATNMLKDLDALDVNPVNMNEMYHLT
ncbi:hypothetical protein OSTOST_23294, partial [Ostertagia ostertagi]